MGGTTVPPSKTLNKPMQTHRNSLDPRHVLTAGRIIQYGCVGCASVDSVQAGLPAPFCEACQRYMVEKSFINGNKVAEIKNRTDDGTGSSPLDKTRADKFKDGMVQRYLAGTVWPRSGRTKDTLEIVMNMDQGAFDKYLVSISWGNEKTMTTVPEINQALVPFDSAPIVVTDPISGMQRTLERPVPKRTNTRIGSFILTGGGNKERFKSRLVTLSAGGQTATFDMADLCNVIIRAL